MLEFREMNRKLVSFVVVFMFCWGFSACSAQASEPIPAIPTPAKTTPAYSAPNSDGCRPERGLLDDLEALLPYEQRVIFHQAYGGEHSLVVWFVEPELGVGTTADNESKAITKAVETASLLAQTSVCAEVVDLVHVTVVGVDYTQWFSGPIRLQDIPPSEGDTAGGGPGEERGAGVSEETAEPLVLPGPDSCAWGTVSATLDVEFGGKGVEANFYYVRDANGNNVFVHWVPVEDQESLESIPLLAQVVEQIGCLYPDPTGISLIVSGEDGVVLLNGYLPGRQSGDGIVFDIDDFTYQLVEP
jgi:hypothetical protein